MSNHDPAQTLRVCDLVHSLPLRRADLNYKVCASQEILDEHIAQKLA